MKKASIQDIALKPGVFASTVPGALSGHPEINPAMRRLRVGFMMREPDGHPDNPDKILPYRKIHAGGLLHSHRAAAGIRISVVDTILSCDPFARLKRVDHAQRK